jgi:hypothetical protein
VWVRNVSQNKSEERIGKPRLRWLEEIEYNLRELKGKR